MDAQGLIQEFDELGLQWEPETRRPHTGKLAASARNDR